MAATDLVSRGQSETVSKPKTGFARFWNTLKQIFHEAIGAVFAVLALAWIQSGIRAWTRDVSHWLIYAAFAFAVLLMFFAWTSFRRARQLRQEVR
jgi:ABC-type Fe3+ transport system permease subunit